MRAPGVFDVRQQVRQDHGRYHAEGKPVAGKARGNVLVAAEGALTDVGQAVGRVEVFRRPAVRDFEVAEPVADVLLQLAERLVFVHAAFAHLVVFAAHDQVRLAVGLVGADVVVKLQRIPVQPFGMDWPSSLATTTYDW
jgi:hypothetical protein